MSKADNRRADAPAVSVSAEKMAIMRRVMEKDWIALRALALGDMYPNLDPATLVKMAEEEKLLR